MFRIKISKDLVKEMLAECKKTKQDFSVLEIQPVSFYVKDDCVANKYSPVVSVSLDTSGEITTTIRANYNSKSDEPEPEPEEKEVVEEAIDTVKETIKDHIIDMIKRLDKSCQAELLAELKSCDF